MEPPLKVLMAHLQSREEMVYDSKAWHASSLTAGTDQLFQDGEVQ